MLTVTDYGLGMDREHVFNYALNYGRSSKREDTATAGKFGLGLKSGLAVANQFTITSIRDGKQTMGFLSLGEADAGVENFCSEAQDTELPNQTTLSVALTDNNSTVNINTKIVRVLGGYNPDMFVVTSPAGTYSFSAEELHSIHRLNEDLVNLGGTVYNAPEVALSEGSWGITAIIGGVTYPIKEGLITHEKQINEAITNKLDSHNCEQYLYFDNIIAHSIVCPVDGVDIPDNRDTLIFSAKTIDTIAEAYVTAILGAQKQATDYFENVTIAQAKYDDDNVHHADTPFVMLHTFAPQWHANAEITARADTVLRDRYRDELIVDTEDPDATLDTLSNLWAKTNVRDVISRQLNAYAFMENNNTQPHPGFNVYDISNYARAYPDNIVEPGKAMFITLDVTDRKTTVTRQYSDGKEYTKQVYIDDKGQEHNTAQQCIQSLFKQYRVRVNTWRRKNQFPTALIGPNPEIYIWERNDFSTVLSFDEFIEQCTTAHRAHLKAQRQAKKAQGGHVTGDVVATLGSLYYRNDQHQPYHYNEQRHNNITVGDLERFADTHNIAPRDLPIVTVTNGDWNKLRDTMSTIALNSPAVVPVVAFLRTTKTNIRKLENAGFTSIFDKDKFIQHCRDTDAVLHDAYFASLSDDERADIGTFIWVDTQCPLLEYVISDESLEYSYFRHRHRHEYEDVLAAITQQFVDRDIDITENAGYIFVRDLIASARRGRALLAAHVSHRHSYIDLDQNNTDTWQFSGNTDDIAEYAQQPVTPDQPITHAICGMLQTRQAQGYTTAPYIGLFTTAEYSHAQEQAAHKNRKDYTPIEQVLFVERRIHLYDVLVRIVQLNW